MPRVERFGRPLARREDDPARRAVRDDVYCVEVMMGRENRRDLPRRRTQLVEHDRLDPRPHACENRVEIADAGINEKEFGGARHGEVLLVPIQVGSTPVDAERLAAASRAGSRRRSISSRSRTLGAQPASQARASSEFACACRAMPRLFTIILLGMTCVSTCPLIHCALAKRGLAPGFTPIKAVPFQGREELPRGWRTSIDPSQIKRRQDLGCARGVALVVYDPDFFCGAAKVK